MINLFKGGIKGRLFLTIRRRGGNNPASSGEGEKKMKKGIVFVVAIIGALVLVGWGCGKNSVAPTDTNSDTNEVSDSSQDNTPEVTPDATGEVPAGWTEYENMRWGVNFIYPTGWQYHEYGETVEGEEVVTLAFSDQELPGTLPPEPLFPIMIFRDTGTVENAMADYTDVVSSEDVTLGSRAVKKIIYYSNILEQNDRVYIVPLRDGVLRVFVPDGTSYVSTAENMIANLTEVE
ncbi:MAG: hypothetical protein WC348_03155 [Patescibacteria group bacterium]|jgi:hypothetical protein